MRNFIIGGTFAAGFASLWFVGAKPELLALNVNEHLTNLIGITITAAVTGLGTISAFLHIATPSFMLPKADTTETPPNA